MEELSGFINKFLEKAKNEKKIWLTLRTEMILEDICENINEFTEYAVKYTKYGTEQYKNSGQNLNYKIIVQKAIAEIKGRLTH